MESDISYHVQKENLDEVARMVKKIKDEGSSRSMSDVVRIFEKVYDLFDFNPKEDGACDDERCIVS